MALNPPPGAHILTLVDNKGNTISTNFTILSKDK